MLIIMRSCKGTSLHSQNERRKVFKINKNCNSYFEQIIRASHIILSTSPHNKNNGVARPTEQKCIVIVFTVVHTYFPDTEYNQIFSKRKQRPIF